MPNSDERPLLPHETAHEADAESTFDPYVVDNYLKNQSFWDYIQTPWSKTIWEKGKKWFSLSNLSILGGFFMTVELLAASIAATEAVMGSMWLTEAGTWYSKYKMLQHLEGHQLREARIEFVKSTLFLIGVTCVVGSLFLITNITRAAGFGAKIIGIAGATFVAAPIIFTALTGIAMLYHTYGMVTARTKQDFKEHAKGMLLNLGILGAVVGGLLTGTAPIMLTIGSGVCYAYVLHKSGALDSLWTRMKKIGDFFHGKKENEALSRDPAENPLILDKAESPETNDSPDAGDRQLFSSIPGNADPTPLGNVQQCLSNSRRAGASMRDTESSSHCVAAPGGEQEVSAASQLPVGANPHILLPKDKDQQKEPQSPGLQPIPGRHQ